MYNIISKAYPREKEGFSDTPLSRVSVQHLCQRIHWLENSRVEGQWGPSRNIKGQLIYTDKVDQNPLVMEMEMQMRHKCTLIIRSTLQLQCPNYCMPPANSNEEGWTRLKHSIKMKYMSAFLKEGCVFPEHNSHNLEHQLSQQDDTCTLKVAHLIATLGLRLTEVAKGFREVLAVQFLSLLQPGMQYQSLAYSLSFKVISVENSLTAGYACMRIPKRTCAHTVTQR